MYRRRYDRCRGVGTHAARIGAGVSIANPLMILARRHRQYVFAIDEHDEAGFFPIQKVFDNNPSAGAAELVAREHVINCGVRFIERHRHDNAFASG